MIILDTDVLSGLMRPVRDVELGGWINQQPVESIWTTAITFFEIRFGIDLLPQGRRRTLLETSFARCFQEDLQEHIVDFDREAAREAASMSARRQLAGRPVEIRDIEIAGIVAAHHATLATRNVRHFENLGIEVVNPWA